MIVTVSRSMISNAKREDKAKNRPIVLDEYITIEYIDNMYIAQEGLCDYCKCILKFGPGINRSTCPDGLTLDRMDNNLPHAAANCTLACVQCNRIKNCFRTADFMKMWGRQMKTKTHRTCYKCKEIKLANSFYPRPLPRSYRGLCIACDKIDRRRYHKNKKQNGPMCIKNNNHNDKRG